MKREPYFTTELEWHKPDELPSHGRRMLVLVKTEEKVIFSTLFFYNTNNKFKFLEDGYYTILAWADISELEDIAKSAMERAEQPEGIPGIDEVLEDFFTTDIIDYIKKNNN